MSTDSKKIRLNFIFGLFGQAVTLAIGLLLPRLFIMSYGSEVNGFINSVNQVFVYVALLEAGVGSASLQALYAPVGLGDKNKINGILSATNKFYKKTAWIYLTLMTVLSFVYPLTLKTTLNYWLMVGLILLIGGGGVLAYFFQAKYKLLLSVDGKDYVNSAISTGQQVLLSLGKAILLLCGFNVLVVQSVYLLLNATQAIIYQAYIKHKYGWIDLKVPPDTQAISQKNSVLIHQISTLIFNNTDVLLLTFFCDLKSASIYALYKNFINMIGMLVSNFANSVNFKLGQSYHNDREEFLKLHNMYETIHVTITFVLCTVAYIFFAPFLTLYTAGMDTNYLLKYLPLLVIIIEILSYARMPIQNVISYAGHFKQTQWRSLAEAIINLGSSIILVTYFGIYGVLLGTVIALLYRINDVIFYSNHRLLKRSVWKSYKLWLLNIVFSVAIVCAAHWIPFPSSNYFGLIGSAAVVCIIVLPMQLLVNFLANRDARKYVLKIIKKS